MLFNEGVAAGKTLFADALKDLGGTVRMGFEHAENAIFEGVEFALSLRGRSGTKPLSVKPTFDSARVQGEPECVNDFETPSTPF
jgi:hypothetical protein